MAPVVSAVVSTGPGPSVTVMVVLGAVPAVVCVVFLLRLHYPKRLDDRVRTRHRVRADAPSWRSAPPRPRSHRPRPESAGERAPPLWGICVRHGWRPPTPICWPPIPPPGQPWRRSPPGGVSPIRGGSPPPTAPATDRRPRPPCTPDPATRGPRRWGLEGGHLLRRDWSGFGPVASLEDMTSAVVTNPCRWGAPRPARLLEPALGVRP